MSKATDPIRFANGVTIYPPKPGATEPYHRIVWTSFDGKRKQTRRKDRPDAEAVAADLAAQLAAGPTVDQAGTERTMRELSVWFLHPDSRQRPWSLGHERKQTSIVNTWLLPRLGHVRCRDLTRQDCTALLNGARGKVSAEYVRAIGVCLRQMVTVGREAGYFDTGHDPMLGVRYTPRSSTQGQSTTFVPLDRRPDTASVDRLAEAAAAKFEPWWWLAVKMAAQCGLRWGELAALQAGDVDLDAGTVSIVRQVTYDGAAPHRHLPKYEKVRETFLPGFLVAPLADHIGGLRATAPRQVCPDSCREIRREAPAGTGPILFGAPRTPYWRNTAWHSRRFRPACVEAGWPKAPAGGWLWTWHDLRHHFCTWALAAAPDGLGLEVADVAYFAGHATPDFTYKAYVSTRQGAVDRARQAAARYRAA